MARRTEKPSISVRLRNNQTGETISFTLDPIGFSLESVARTLNDEARRRWASVTNINDSRHKRR